MRQPSVSIAIARDSRSPYAAARALSWLLFAFASWTCGGGGGGGDGPTSSPPTTGSLMVSVSGLPAGTTAQGSITGPSGFNASLTGTQLFQGLAPGSYTVTPSSVSGSGTTYVSSAQSGIVVAGQTANVGITYSRVENPVLSVVGGGTGTGSGRLSSTPAGIDCTITDGVASGTCSAAFASGATVQLTVVQGTLTSWGSDCTGTAPCMVTMSQSHRVAATFAVPPIIVIITTKPVVVASRAVNSFSLDYSMKNGGSGTWAPTVSNANLPAWVQASIVGDSVDTKLRLHFEATNLLPYSESKTPYVTSTVVSNAGADPVTVTIKYAKTFDQPAGMAATIVRFHRFTGEQTDTPPPPNLVAAIDLLDARSAKRISAKILEVNPSDQNWLATPTINSNGQLVLQVRAFPVDSQQKPSGNLPSGSNFGSPIRIRLGSLDGSTTCPALTVGAPDPSCQVFVYYDADGFPRLILNPWGVELTPTSPNASAIVGRQSNSPASLGAPTLLSHDCGNKLSSPPIVSSSQVTVSGNFAAITDDSTVTCTVLIGASYFDTNFNKQLTDTARLRVTLAKPGPDAITPSRRDLNVLGTAGGSLLDSWAVDLSNLGPKSISVKAPTFDGAAIDGHPACPAALLPTPTIAGTTIGRGSTATVTVRINPVNQPAQVCSATLGLHATGVPDESIPVIIRIK
jgi:hypothetical protein